MDESAKNVVKNILTIGGSIAVACALLDEIFEDSEQKMEKLAMKEKEHLPLLTEGEKPAEKHDASQDDVIAELKRKLAEYESKQQEQTEQKESAEYKPQF